MVDVTGLTSLLVVVGMGGESVGGNTSGYGSAGYGGGGGGYWGGGAGFNGDTPSGNSGAGGGSSYIGSNRLTEIVTANASGRTAGNSTDTDRGSYATGGLSGTAGTAGVVIIGY